MKLRKSKRKEIFVFAHWQGMKNPQRMGILYSEVVRGKEIFSFEYNKDWLKSPFVQILDPDLQLHSGIQYLSEKKPNFGLFLDSSPDRWGRLLMKRREAAYARIQNRPVRKLFETDFLMGVYDEQRMGAIRFKEDEKGPFLNNEHLLRVPPMSSLNELSAICLQLEDDNAVEEPAYLTWLNMLMNPGSSIGGARPKAGIIDENQILWIAKFPSKHDTVDSGGWEIVTNILARNAGINVAEGKAMKLSSRHHTFLSKRFDRNTSGERIHFASAMTLLGYNDDDFHSGASYHELAEFIIKQGANVQDNLEELWRRIVFSIAVSNTDDHLRNHGFLLTNNGWILSPAYDINPVADGFGLKLNINEHDNSLDFDLAISVCGYFRINRNRAHEIMEKVVESVSQWQRIASSFGLTRNEIETMSSAFSNV
jgi:serine/threonine-protein kinase HipA